MDKNIINQLGPLAIGARMRRLTDMFSKDVIRIYKEHGLDFDPKHFILFYLIAQKNSIGIMEAADELSFSHPAIIHMAKELEKKGFIESVKSPTDNRKRLLQLSKKGETALPEFNKLWDKIRLLNANLIASQQHNLLKSIAEMEAILEEQSFYKRFSKI